MAFQAGLVPARPAVCGSALRDLEAHGSSGQQGPGPAPAAGEPKKKEAEKASADAAEPAQGETRAEPEQPTEAVKSAALEADFRSGELIGKLERVIVAALVLSGAATAIGFVLTAKSVARFKQMEEDRNFAERYLVGTLLSVAVALAAALLVKHCL